MAKLYHQRATPSLITATDAQAGYDPANMASEALRREWRATSAGAKTVDITIPAANLAGVLLHDVNFAIANIRTSTDGTTFSGAVAMSTYANRRGRRRGLLASTATGVVKVRIEIASGTPTDGLTYWRIGHAAIYRAALTLAVAPRYPYAAPIIQPKVATDLANGQRAQADSGSHYQRIELPFRRKETQNMDDVVSLSRRGAVALDMEIAQYPEQIWPVRLEDDEVQQSYPSKRIEELQLLFREQV